MAHAIEGLHNFRDTGGMPLIGGGTTRAGVLYRSAALDRLTDAGLEALADSPIGVVADFRTPDERRAAPDRLPPSRPIEILELSLLEGAMAEMAQRVLASGGAADPALVEHALAQLPTLDQLYVGMLQHGAASFAEVARRVGASRDDEPTAVLVHCTAGKDRTGVAVALLLDAAGVERDAVVADYAASQQHLAGAWADGMLAMISSLGMPLTPALRTLVTETPPSAIRAALDWIDRTHGGAADYLATGGLSADGIDALRRRLRGGAC
ncbi:tyrosine-protein phosphatase [Microbacterium hominis]|uniref:tyrosine-protein phosphatase n=1 Tax=Microbacterium TaxID=33882 RepID=UPI00168BF5DC|nr:MULTISPECIES: tyrosine-protein phosphatase [Microbacterium]QOC24507.1 tyrosine-protein phosphatase [Microbacterium hominis]QOC28579.1 tyrosine-protein phosphatase [Microbacterium hominis]QYF99194.1 tyrosine-protein phosphatase [Microbacterium sp. PAMC21962]